MKKALALVLVSAVGVMLFGCMMDIIPGELIPDEIVDDDPVASAEVELVSLAGIPRGVTPYIVPSRPGSSNDIMYYKIDCRDSEGEDIQYQLFYSDQLVEDTARYDDAFYVGVYLGAVYKFRLVVTDGEGRQDVLYQIRVGALNIE